MANQLPSNESIEWQAESLRLTAFPSPDARIGQSNWWTELFKEQPEDKTEKPREGLVQEQGPFEGGKILLGIQPFRIDWLFTPADEERVIGPFSQALETFLAPMRRWLHLSPSLIRIAFGAVLVSPTDSRESGYRKISPLLPSVKIDSEGSSDLLYQINRSRNSQTGLAGLRINRLSKWSVTAWGLSTIRFGPKGQPMDLIQSQQSFGCRLELDMNTAQDFESALPHDALGRVFQELVDLGIEIAQKGDIA